MDAAVSTILESLPTRHRQVLLATATDWRDTRGELQLLSRNDTGWRPREGDTIGVSFGRGGFAWGSRRPGGRRADPVKTEGDGCSPVGIFGLGPAFGYASGPPAGCRLPYRQATDRDFWVDAPEAPEYNRWVTLPAGEDPATRWRCWERMRRDDAQYSMGLVVHYNLGPVRPGAGSAIFMHVWRAAGDSTAGCTAMNPEGMQEVLAWLDPALRPVLLQGPLSALSLLATPPLPGAPGGSGDDST